LQTAALDVIERMSHEDFLTLMWEMRMLVRIGMWVEGVPGDIKINKSSNLNSDFEQYVRRMTDQGLHSMNHEAWKICGKCGEEYDMRKGHVCAVDHEDNTALALAYEFHPTNKDNH